MSATDRAGSGCDLRDANDLVRRFTDAADRWPPIRSELVVLSPDLRADQVDSLGCGLRGGSWSEPPPWCRAIAYGTRRITIRGAQASRQTTGQVGPGPASSARVGSWGSKGTVRVPASAKVRPLVPTVASLMPHGVRGREQPPAEATRHFDELAIEAWQVLESLHEAAWIPLARPVGMSGRALGVYRDAWLAERKRGAIRRMPVGRSVDTALPLADRWLLALHNLAWTGAGGWRIRASLSAWETPGASSSLELLTRADVDGGPRIAAVRSRLTPLRWFQSVLEGNVFRVSAAAVRILADAARASADPGRSDPPVRPEPDGASSSASSRPPTVPPHRRETRLRWLLQAMLLVGDQPGLSNADIARAVGKSPGTLSRCPEFRRAAELARQRSPRKGSVEVERRSGATRVDAVDDSRDPNRPASRQGREEEEHDEVLDRELQESAALRNAARNASR